MEKINDTRSWFFEKINKMGKSLVRLIKKNIGITKIKNEKEVTINTTETKRTITYYYK